METITEQSYQTLLKNPMWQKKDLRSCKQIISLVNAVSERTSR